MQLPTILGYYSPKNRSSIQIHIWIWTWIYYIYIYNIQNGSMSLTSSQLLRMMFCFFFLPKTFAQTQYVNFLMSLFLTLYNIIHFAGFNRLHTSPCSQTEVLLAKAPTVGRHPGARAQAQHLWPLGASPSRCSIAARRPRGWKIDRAVAIRHWLECCRALLWPHSHSCLDHWPLLVSFTKLYFQGVWD